jgi:hypothetical protein
VLGESEPISGLGLELPQSGFDVPQPARKNSVSKAGRNRLDLREGMEMVGMRMLLCLLSPTPALLKSFGILPLAARLRSSSTASIRTETWRTLARDVDEIGYVEKGNWYLAAIGGTFLAGNAVGYAAWGRQKRKPQAT